MPDNTLKELPEAKQLLADLYGCQVSRIDDLDYMKKAVRQICAWLHTDIVEECYHKFSPIGISAVAVITASHLSIHTWPEYGYAAVDIFSCKDELPEEICSLLTELLGARETETRLVTRNLVRKEDKRHGHYPGIC